MRRHDGGPSWLFLALWLLQPSLASAGIQGTAHDLAAGGSQPAEGGNRSGGGCVECHAPHNAEPTRALWNRELSGLTYQLYESSTTAADLQQPTGTSRLCLSCHDGTVALAGPRVGRQVSKAIGRPLSGRSSLGVDLSDDHPISFVYDAALATRKEELADPSQLPARVRLEDQREMQCTSCHDPHEDRFPHFLVMDNRYSMLCRTCHQLNSWSQSVHATSGDTWSGRGDNPWPHAEDGSVAEHGCENCHTSHSARHAQWLLTRGTEAESCMECHDGTLSSRSIDADLQKPSAHPVGRSPGVHDPTEDFLLMKRHVECGDCHDPHAMQPAEPGDSRLPGPLRGARGVTAAGSAVVQASFEYEVCYACHGLVEQEDAGIARMDQVTNARLEFDPDNPSFHPVVGPGRSPEIRGLIDGRTVSSVILCGDCHASDSSLNPSGTRGPHGSVYEPILEREYQLGDLTVESAQSYALCYKCHDRALLLGEQSGFPHREHVLAANGACAVCHDAHGSRRYDHLINFMTRGKAGATVVGRSGSGRMEFEDLGPRAGNCYLSCHGVDHDPLGYRR